MPGKRTLTEALPVPSVDRTGLAQPPTIHDIATATVQNKDTGSPADPALRAGVEGVLGMPVPEARVHQDAKAQAGAAAIGARAFAHGIDIFLGPGESASNRPLMSHELTHVAQQAGGGSGMQAKAEVGEPGTPAENQADAVADAVTAGAPAAVLVDDAAVLAPGQMHLREFIAQLQPVLTAAASEELGSLWSVAGCPYISKYLAAYAQRPARDGEAFIRRFTQSKATTAAALIPDMVARVRAGVRYWRDTGKAPPEIADADPAAAAAATAAASGPAGAQLARAEGAPPDRAITAAAGPDAVQLGRAEGAPLDGAIASAASNALGASLADVRIHAGATGDRVARAHDALAVTVGNHIALRSDADQPGTPAGEALMAHELAHVAQQQGATTTAPAGSEHADEASADSAAVGVLGRLWGGTLRRLASAARSQQIQRSGLALRRCGSDAKPAKAMDKARYTAIEARLQELVAKKKAAVENGGDMAAIDTEIDSLIQKLRADFGVRMEKGQILDAAVADKDMLVVDGRIVPSPSGAEHFMGERLGFKLEVDHVPPGESLQVGWRWRTPVSSTLYRFLINGPASASKTKSLEMELDTPFWGLVPDEVEKAKGMEVVAEIYIGDATKPTRTLTTGFIAMPERPVGDVTIVGAPSKVVAEQYLDLSIGPWTPDFHGHSIDWFVDDKKVAEDQLGLRRQFSMVGTHKVRADVSTVRRSLGIGDKKPLESAETRIEVMTAEQFGSSYLNELDGSPFKPKPVGLNQVIATGDESLAEIQHHIDQGGSQQAYWEERLKAQQERMGKLQELAPDYATARPLPSDPTRLDPGSYNGQITAALVMAANGGAQPLTVHLTIHGKDGAWSTRIIDSTSRKVLKYDGAGATPLDAFASAFDTWQANNEYPTGGRIVHRFAPSGWSKGDGFDTYTAWKRAKEWVDGIITVGGFIVGALLLADPDPTLSKLLGGILMAAVIARSSVAIYERICDGGDVLSSENILDAVAIVTSFMGLTGGALRAVGIKTVNPMIYRAANWTIMGALTGDIGTFVYVSAEAIAQMKAIEGDPTLDDGQKSAETLRIMASLFASGAMLVVANRELLQHGLKPSDFISSKVPTGTKPELDVGMRLDAEYELKQTGQWTKETSKLSDEALLDQVFLNRSRVEIENELAKEAGAKAARDLVNAVGNQAFVDLHAAFGDKKFAAAATQSDAASLKTLPFGDRAMLEALAKLETAELKTLVGKIAPRSPDARAALWSLDLPTLKRVGLFLTGPEIEVLASLGGPGLKKVAALHSFNLKNLATLTPAQLAELAKLDPVKIEKLSALDHGELAKAAPFDELSVDAKLASVATTEANVDAKLTEPHTEHHLRDTNFLDRGGKPNTSGKAIKVKLPGKSVSTPIVSDRFVRLEPVPPGAPGGATPTTINKVTVEAPKLDASGGPGPVIKGDLVKGPTDWEVPVPSSDVKVVVETSPGGAVPYTDVEQPPPGTRIQLKPKDIANLGFAGGHTRDAWNTAMKQYGDFVIKTAETGIKFQLPGSGTMIEATAIEAAVTIPGSGTKPAITKPMPDPKTVFETPAQLDAFEKHAKPFIAAKIEAVQAQVPPLDAGKVFTTEVPVRTSAGEDAVISIQIPWYPDVMGQLNKMPTWWLAKSNFAKGGAFNP